MINRLPRNIFRFVVLVFLQILIFNNIQFSGLINPYFYIVFILLLPFETPPWLLLLSSFLLGLSIDIFSQTLGMHAFACVMMAFFRPLALNILAPREGYAVGSYPRVFHYGVDWFLKYTIILTAVHHLSLFYIEMFSFGGFFITFIRALLSTIFTALLVIISQYFAFRK